ncbi:hypothetical protein Cs7R123_47220 [Catellatospora sp. TT07R-123]|nr:hypothetical protein Cs7R123_47220 [Catellatospora sp. TT07R-123]
MPRQAAARLASLAASIAMAHIWISPPAVGSRTAAMSRSTGGNGRRLNSPTSSPVCVGRGMDLASPAPLASTCGAWQKADGGTCGRRERVVAADDGEIVEQRRGDDRGCDVQ